MMEAFHVRFPEAAKQETRIVTLLRRHAGLPAGEYAFFELYCTEHGCDCDNVMINVVERTRGHLATLNHGLSEDSFADVGMSQTFLDTLNKQSRYSQALLELFRESVLDEAYAQRLRRHLDMMKATVGRTPSKKPGPVDRARRLVGDLAMMPCPCGSGKPCIECRCRLSRAREIRRATSQAIQELKRDGILSEGPE